MQVIAHRANSLDLVKQALDWGCDYAEVDVWEDPTGQLIITRQPDTGADLLESILALPVGLYLDVRHASASTLAGALAGRDRTVIWSSADFLERLHEFDSTLPVMPQAASEQHLITAIARLKPTAVAFDHRDFTAPLIGRAQQAGARIFVDRLREHDQPWHWEAAWQAGADAIQTDRPRELLRSLGR